MKGLGSRFLTPLSAETVIIMLLLQKTKKISHAFNFYQQGSGSNFLLRRRVLSVMRQKYMRRHLERQFFRLFRFPLGGYFTIFLQTGGVKLIGVSGAYCF